MSDLISAWFALFASYNVPDDVVGFGFIVMVILCFNTVLGLFKRICLGKDK